MVNIFEAYDFNCQFEDLKMDSTHIDLNMKYYLLLFVLSPILAFSQKLSEGKVTIYSVSDVDEMVISPSISFASNKHQWTLGPTLLISFGDQIEEREKFKLSGVAVGYEHFLHGREGKWNLYHSFDFLAQRITDTQSSQYFDISNNTFVPNRIEQSATRLFLGVSAGVLFNISEKLSLDQNIGIGVSSEFRKTSSDFDEFTDTFLSRRWLLKFGIRYRL